MPLRAVIFDRDGVLTYFDVGPAVSLIGSFPGIQFDRLRQRWTAWCASHETPTTTEKERDFLAKFWDDVGEAWSLGTEVRALLHAFDYTTMIRAFDDSRPALIALRRRGLRIGVLSNFPMPSIDASLEAAGLADLIDGAASAPTIGCAKPAAAAYLHMTQILGVEPHETLMIDNEIKNVEGARTIGMQALLLSRGTVDSKNGLPDLKSVVDFIERD